MISILLEGINQIMMTATIRTLFILLLLAPVATPASSQPITLDQFFDKIKSTHPFFRKESLTPRIERKEQEKFLGAKDWVVRSDPYYAHEERDSLSSFAPTKVDKASINAGAEKTFWETGGVLSFNFDYTYTEQTGKDLAIDLPGGPIFFPSDSGRFHENGLTISYFHPLLKNNGGLLSRIGYDMQGYGVTASEIIAMENKENFLLGVGDKFIDWALLAEQRRILGARLQIAEEEFTRTKKKRKQNLVDKVDVIRAKNSVLTVEQNLSRVEAVLKATRAELASLAQDESISSQNPAFNIYSISVIPPFDIAAREMKNKSRLLNVLKIETNQLELKSKGAEEETKAELGLKVAGGLSGGGDNYGNSHDYDRPQYSAGLNFSYPLGNRAATAEVEKTRIEKDRVREDIKNVTLKLESGLRNLITQMDELEKVLELNKELVGVSKEKTGEELKRYNQGRSELTFVLQSRDEEHGAQLHYAQNGATYNKLLLRYRALMDELIESN